MALQEPNAGIIRTQNIVSMDYDDTLDLWISPTRRCFRIGRKLDRRNC